METAPDDQPLSNSRYVTLVVRLVLDRQGRIVRGELVEVQRSIRRWFSDWHGFVRLLHSWIGDDKGATEGPEA